MTNEIISLLDPSVYPESKIADLCWTSNWCGLAKKYTAFAETGNQQIVKVCYPVKCNTTEAECKTKAAYTSLAPDSTKKSIVYFMERSPLESKEVWNRGRKKSARTSGRQRDTQVLDMFVWLNYKKLGYDGCSMCDAIFAELRKIFRCVCPTPSDWEYHNAIKKFSFKVVAKNTHEYTMAKMKQFTYSEEHCLWIKPFEICSFKVVITYDVILCLLPVIECAEPVPCP